RFARAFERALPANLFQLSGCHQDGLGSIRAALAIPAVDRHILRNGLQFLDQLSYGHAPTSRKSSAGRPNACSVQPDHDRTYGAMETLRMRHPPRNCSAGRHKAGPRTTCPASAVIGTPHKIMRSKPSCRATAMANRPEEPRQSSVECVTAG